MKQLKGYVVVYEAQICDLCSLKQLYCLHTYTYVAHYQHNEIYKMIIDSNSYSAKSVLLCTVYTNHN